MPKLNLSSVAKGDSDLFASARGDGHARVAIGMFDSSDVASTPRLSTPRKLWTLLGFAPSHDQLVEAPAPAPSKTLNTSAISRARHANALGLDASDYTISSAAEENEKTPPTVLENIGESVGELTKSLSANVRKASQAIAGLGEVLPTVTGAPLLGPSKEIPFRSVPAGSFLLR